MNERRNVGLARALSKLGYCSRSQAADLIVAGRVRLNGSVPRNPETPVRMEKDRIEVDGKPVAAAPLRYFVLHKPRGIVTSADDEQGRKTVYSLLPTGTPFVGPVGRLDKASEGLLLLTNDSEWAARITAPESHLDKTYHVQVRTDSAENLIPRLLQGVMSENQLLRASAARIVRHGRVHAWLEIVLHEGRNRHIRRMLETMGVEVRRLLRISIGPLELGDLPKGASRQLTPQEKSALDGALAKKDKSADAHARDR
jgi:23S rRNA pseudouridine2605 synthase